MLPLYKKDQIVKLDPKLASMGTQDRLDNCTLGNLVSLGDHEFKIKDIRRNEYGYGDLFYVIEDMTDDQGGGRYLISQNGLARPEPVEVKPIKIPKNMTANSILGQDKTKKQLAVAVDKNIPVLLIGDTGTGKTTIVKDLATSKKQTWVRFNLTGDTTIEEFVGKYTLENGDTKWQDGILLNAMKQGHWLIVDEINVARADILFVLHSLLDDDRNITVSNHDNEVVTPHENFRFFGTINPVEEYAGTKDLNKAFLSRFGMILTIDYPTPRYEVAILQAKAGIDSATASRLVDVAQILRKAKKDGELFYTCSTRDLIQVAALLDQLEIEQALDVAIVNKAGSDSDKVKSLLKSLGLEYKRAEAEAGTLNIELIQAKINELKNDRSQFELQEQKHKQTEAKLLDDLDKLAKKSATLEAELEARYKNQEAELRQRIKTELVAELVGQVA